MNSALTLLAVATLALAACEGKYVYRPAVTTTTSATIAGRPASYYEVPSEAPTGHVRLATVGFAQIAHRDEPNGPVVQALHVEMKVANNSDRPWTVDTRDQRATIPGYGESRAAYAIADQGSPPVINVAPRSERTIELFYPLPGAEQKASQLPAFDVVWTVDTGVRRVVERTPFERARLDEGVGTGPYTDASDWSGPSWYDPLYFGAGAFSGVGFRRDFTERPVVIRRRYVTPH
jgi:hypothetical protein